MKKSFYAYLAASVGLIIIGAVAMIMENTEVFSKIMITAGCICAFMGLLLGNSRKKSHAYTRIGTESEKYSAPAMSFDDVAANDAARKSLMGLADYLKNPEKYSANGARMPKGVLLYGPPGTGKTLLARALAGEAKVPYFAMSGSDFVHMYVGVGAGRVRDLFKKARKAGKCVIFIDEIDALGRRRSDAASEERDQTLNALLSEMSGFREGEGIIVLAATNRMETLDPALLRPGRFDRHIEVGLPGKKERLDILRLHSRNKPLDTDVNLEKLAEDTCTFSGASLEALLNEAAILAAERGSEKIRNDDIERAFINTIAGPDRHPSANVEERSIIALHEAGHAIVSHILIPENRLKRISILPASRSMAGYNLSIPQEKSILSKRHIENQISVILGGRAAEMMINGDDGITSGASGDLARAAELAGLMITELGMGDDPAVSLKAVSISCASSMKADADVQNVLDRMFIKAREVLEQNAHLLMTLTEELITRETLNEEEIRAILNRKAG